MQSEPGATTRRTGDGGDPRVLPELLQVPTVLVVHPLQRRLHRGFLAGALEDFDETFLDHLVDDLGADIGHHGVGDHPAEQRFDRRCQPAADEAELHLRVGNRGDFDAGTDRPHHHGPSQFPRQPGQTDDSIQFGADNLASEVVDTVRQAAVALGHLLGLRPKIFQPGDNRRTTVVRREGSLDDADGIVDLRQLLFQDLLLQILESRLHDIGEIFIADRNLRTGHIAEQPG
ncbi:hypothetical protein [Nocardia pneumoniae]|uniref:hypothetical protein n=1 Tax=Nocardia pneumoniae TaxID=228601 RepID=UPI0012F6FCA7|nr:hypothetical protein [Nocardia pneumoniae]